MLFSYKHVLFRFKRNHFWIRSVLIERPQYSIYQKRGHKIKKTPGPDRHLAYIIFLVEIKQINKIVFKNNFLDRFCESKRIAKIYGAYYNPRHQGAVEAFNKTVQILFNLAKDHQNKNII